MFWFVTTLLGMKLLWNFYLPYGAIYAVWKSDDGSTSISAHPIVDIALASLATILSASVNTQLGFSQLAIGGYLFGAVFVSYAHCGIVGFASMWLLANQESGS